MKRLIAMLLCLMLALTAVSLTACNNAKSTSPTESAASVPEGLTPNSLNAQGNPTGFYKVDKDDKGRVTRNYSYDAQGALTGSIGYEYDNNDNVIKEIYYTDKGEIDYQTAFEKNAEGLVTKRTDMDAQGNPTAITVTEYRDEGGESAVFYYDGSNVLLSYTTFMYDENGELIKMTKCKADDTIEYFITYEKDANGNVVEKKFDSEGNPVSQ